MSDLAYIYLLQDGKDKGTSVYKVGRTIQQGGDGRKLTRLQNYSKGTVPYNTWKVHEKLVNEIENKIKKAFTAKYHLIRGSEWFQGDVHQMKKDIDHIIENIEEPSTSIHDSKIKMLEDIGQICNNIVHETNDLLIEYKYKLKKHLMNLKLRDEKSSEQLLRLYSHLSVFDDSTPRVIFFHSLLNVLSIMDNMEDIILQG